jgi:hypothetical protein
MKTVLSLQQPLAIALLIISINFGLLAATIAGLCFVMEIKPASTPFLQAAGLSALTALWLGYRLKRAAQPVRAEIVRWIYFVGIAFSLIMALLTAIAFSHVAPTNRWIDLIIISNGLFIILCISIKLNDTNYMLE